MSGDDWFFLMMCVACFFVGMNAGMAIMRHIYER